MVGGWAGDMWVGGRMRKPAVTHLKDVVPVGPVDELLFRVEDHEGIHALRILLSQPVARRHWGDGHVHLADRLGDLSGAAEHVTTGARGTSEDAAHISYRNRPRRTTSSRTASACPPCAKTLWPWPSESDTARHGQGMQCSRRTHSIAPMLIAMESADDDIVSPIADILSRS